MKILVFEYITGGGFNKQELPDSLAREGCLMLEALLDNLSELEDTELVLMLDWRFIKLIARSEINVVVIESEHDSHEKFFHLAQQCDAIWPIAPEFDGILQTLCQGVESLGKILLTSPATAVALTANKFNVYQHLCQQAIATVATRIVNADLRYSSGEWIIKPIDGVGCADSYLINDSQDFARISKHNGEYIIQPHIQGKKTSLSCLFKQGQGSLMCVNLQRFDIINKQYQLSAIEVNYLVDLNSYRELVDAIAQAIPELWGYAGIDLIETPEQRLVLEINPRLTTSFVGIYAATGINVAEQVLKLLTDAPDIKTTCNQTILIKVKQHESTL
ncbi:MAG: ATP-grasp domain-containing protein [Methylovulum sp.]